ncbi:hypothetical protein MTO96_029493 [Rhipicephalus appendiculatus]
MVTRTGFGAPGSDGGRTANQTLAPETRHSGSPLSGAVADDADTTLSLLPPQVVPGPQQIKRGRLNGALSLSPNHLAPSVSPKSSAVKQR